MADNKKLTIGIIGGMGPAATIDLFAKIVRATPAEDDVDHLNVQIDSNPVPGARVESLCQRAARLERCGADLLTIPCNEAHIHYDAVQAAVNIPIVSMIEEAVLAAARFKPSVKKVAILAWHKTLAAGIYQKAVKDQDMEPLAPFEDELPPITELIQAVKANSVTAQIKTAAVDIGNALIERGAGVIILGCTELPIALSQKDFSVPVVDATQALADAAVRMALGV